jgi:ethanolamine utilization protein EutQ
MRVMKYTRGDVAQWWQRGDQYLYLGGVLDNTSDAKMSVGFIRYRKGESNPWTVTYDEALIVTKGAYTVRTDDGPVTARAGEVIYLPAGAKVVYEAPEDTEVVYVTYPHWIEATENSDQAAALAEFHPAPAPSDMAVEGGRGA